MNPENMTSTTTDAGIAMPSDDNSLTIGPDGPDGPILLHHDHYLITGPASETHRESRFERGALPPVHQAVVIVVAAAGAEPSLRHADFGCSRSTHRVLNTYSPSVR
jgi:hypothetical protein